MSESSSVYRGEDRRLEGGHVDSKGGGRCPSRGGGNKKGRCSATKGINYQIRTVIFSTLM